MASKTSFNSFGTVAVVGAFPRMGTRDRSEVPLQGGESVRFWLITAAIFHANLKMKHSKLAVFGSALQCKCAANWFHYPMQQRLIQSMFRALEA